MRLVMTTDTVGGVWTYSTDLERQMLARGWAVMLVTVGPDRPSTAQEAVLAEAAMQWRDLFSTRHVEAPLEWMEDGGHCYEQTAAQMLGICNEFGPDVVHSNQFCYGALPVGAPKVVVAHSDVLSWWRARYGEAMPEAAWRARYREIVHAGLRGAKAVVAPTRAYAEELRHEFDPGTQTWVIANGRETASAGMTEPELFAGKRMQAVTCGRLWDEGKNVRLLEDVKPALPIFVAGEASRVGAAPIRAHRSGSAAGGVAYVGALAPDALEALLRESAIYVVTSRYEPFGLAPVEAAMAGCAIVANDLATLREVWGGDALFFAKNDAEALGALLRELAGDPGRVRDVAARCRARALRCFRSGRMADEYESMYRTLIVGERGAHVA